MPTAPLFRRDEVIYLKSSAEIGKLDSFKINSIKQVKNGRWLYRIDITKKPPSQGLIGDSFDARVVEASIFYGEAELITMCEALDIICTRFRRQVVNLESQLTTICNDEIPLTPALDEPRWALGDEVHFDASARIGFIHSDTIVAIHEVGIQPGSRRTRYCYQVKNVKNQNIFFREDELITKCDALEKALAALQRDLNAAEIKQTNLCPRI